MPGITISALRDWATVHPNAAEKLYTIVSRLGVGGAATGYVTKALKDTFKAAPEH